MITELLVRVIAARRVFFYYVAVVLAALLLCLAVLSNSWLVVVAIPLAVLVALAGFWVE